MNTKTLRSLRLILLTQMVLASMDMSSPSPALADPSESASGVSVSYDRSVSTGDPIAANSGAYHFSMPLLNLGGPLPLRFTLSYRMDSFAGPGMLHRFYSDLMPSLAQMQHRTTGQPIVEVAWLEENVLQFTYDAGAGSWSLDAAAPVRYVLKETGTDGSHGYYYLLDPVKEIVRVFEKVPSEFCLHSSWCPARIVYLMDRNNNCQSYAYTGDSLTPDRVEDGLGRRLDFTYDTDSGVLQRVSDQTGRFVQLNAELQAPDCFDRPVLRSVSDAQGGTTTFHYSLEECEVAAVERPSGNTPYTQKLANVMLNGHLHRRVTAQEDAYGNTTSLAYDSVANRLAETRPDGTTVTYEHYHNNGVPRRITDAEGKALNFSQSGNEQIARVIDRLGDSTNVGYHVASGKLASYQDAEGNTTTGSYTAQSQTFINPGCGETVEFVFYDLTRITYADASYADLTYDAQGNVLRLRQLINVAFRG